jgi:hypothetical protein
MRLAAAIGIASIFVFAAPAHAAPRNPGPRFVISAPADSVQAPADMYFGLYRLSNLSVRNAIHDMTIEGDSPLALPGQIERIAAVQSALGAWALRYPRDPWLRKAMLDFATFLIGKHVPQYDRVALALLDELQESYAATAEGRTSQAVLEQFVLLPEFDMDAGPGVRPMTFIFMSQVAGIGDQRRHHFL